MNTKLVYVVVGSDKDYYVENAWVSAFSAKQHNICIQIYFVTDRSTKTYIQDKKERIKDVVDKFVVVDLPSALNNMQRSRYIKTSLYNYIEGDFLFIDTDTVICDSLSEIDNILNEPNFCIGAVNDRHKFMTINKREPSLTEAAKKIDLCFSESDEIYFNSGVMLVKKSVNSKLFYQKWHQNWLIGLEKGVSIDQVSLALTNQQLNYPIKLLSGIWNCQILTNALKYLCDAKIIHYFATNSITQKPYWFANHESYLELKKTGRFTAEMLSHIANPRKAFLDENEIIVGDELELQKGSIHYLMAKCPFFYKLLKRMANILMSIYCLYRRFIIK